MSIQLNQLFQKLISDGTFQKQDADLLLANIQKNNVVDHLEKEMLNNILEKYSDQFEPDAKLALELFVKENPQNDVSDLNGQRLLFVSLEHFLDDPSNSSLSRVNLPAHLFAVGKNGVPLPGPIGSRVLVRLPKEDIGTYKGINQEVSNIFLNTSIEAMNSFVGANATLVLAEDSYGAKIPWGKNGLLSIDINKEKDSFNAFYSKASKDLNFGPNQVQQDVGLDSLNEEEKILFANVQSILGSNVNLAMDSEVVFHESGHALFDTFLPGLMGTEGAALDESFGDIRGFMNMLKNPFLQNYSLQETIQHLKTVGTSHYEVLDLLHLLLKVQSATRHEYDRNVLNDAVYKPPTELSAEESESHAYSKVMTGATFEILALLVEKDLANGLQRFDELLMKAFDFLPPGGEIKFADFSKALLQSNQQYFGGQYTEELKTVLLKRNLLTEEQITQTIELKEENIKLLPDLPPWFSIDRKRSAEDYLNSHKEELGLTGEHYFAKTDFPRGKKEGKMILQSMASQQLAEAIDVAIQQTKDAGEIVSSQDEKDYRAYFNEAYAPKVSLTLDAEGKIIHLATVDVYGDLLKAQPQLRVEERVERMLETLHLEHSDH